MFKAAILAEKGLTWHIIYQNYFFNGKTNYQQLRRV